MTVNIRLVSSVSTACCCCSCSEGDRVVVRPPLHRCLLTYVARIAEASATATELSGRARARQHLQWHCQCKLRLARHVAGHRSILRWSARIVQ